MEEANLIQNAKRGDISAFNQLVLKYQDQVFNLAYRMMGGAMAAQDVAQDTFISAYQHLNSFHGGSFRAWILRIAANNCYDELRRIKRKPMQPLTVVDDVSGEEMDDPVWLADDGKLPEEFIEGRELEAAIQRCISQLQGNFRAAVILVDVDGMDYTEASQVVGVPVGTIRSRLSRARQQIQKCLRGFQELLPDKYRLNHGRMQ